MTPRTFTGTTSREVLRKVRTALGDDAVIVSNISVEGGIEITALAASDLPGASAPAHVPVVQPSASAAADNMVQQLMRELASMKSMMQRELSGMAWSGMKERAPARAAMMQMLLDDCPIWNAV